MKILRFFLIASFLISLLAGIGAGTFLFHKKANPRQASPASSSMPKFPGGQESIWLIAVDRLDVPTPRVEGIWLLVYIPNYPTITPLPLFPSDNPQQDTELAKMFHFSSGRKIAPEFWDFMKKHNHPAGDYIVFDEVAAVSIMNLSGGVRIQGTLFSGMDALAHIPKTWDDPQGSLRGQVAVMDSVCKSIFNSQSRQTLPGMDMVNKEIGKHILSNLNLEKKSMEWQKVISSGNHKACDFTYLYEKIYLTSNP